MQKQQSKPRFVLSAQQSVVIAAVPGQQPCSDLVFNVSKVSAPFAWLGNGRRTAPHLPFAKVGIWEPPASADVVMKRLLSEEPDEPQGPKRGHTDDWYQQRCIFCAKCKATINSHYQKKGSRCQGCRRWFHAACMLATAPSVAGAAGTAAGTAAQDSAEEQEGPAGLQDSSSSSSSQAKRHRGLFFHDDDCQEVYDRLAVVAAGGPQPFTLPDQRPFWEKLFNAQSPHQDYSYRLLDLAEVRRLYKDAQKRDTLFRELKKVQRQLDAAAKAAAEREEAAKRSRGWGFGSSKGAAGQGSDGATGGEAAAGGSSRRRGRATSLEEFLVVSEVLKPLGESPRDLLEDSYAIITRDSRDGPAAVATFNIYGSDHARLQGVATPAYMQRRGHATRLLQQVELLLADAGVQDMVVILEPQDEKAVKKNSQLLPPDSAKHWFRQRLGYKPVSSEAQMLWRREIPEYHKGLIGGCSLLVKPLPKAKAVVKRT